MKVYISGKITGDAGYKQKFKTAQNILESAGFEVFNPAEQEDTGKSWTWYMRKDIAGAYGMRRNFSFERLGRFQRGAA